MTDKHVFPRHRPTRKWHKDIDVLLFALVLPVLFIVGVVTNDVDVRQKVAMHDARAAAQVQVANR